MDTSVLIAVIAAASAISAALIAAVMQRNVRRLEEQFEERKQVNAFLGDQLTRLYLPVSMRLRATRALANTHYQADAATRREIEHALREHNKAITTCLLESAMYLDPDAPDEVTVALLQHLLQWENVYILKYQYKVVDAPIWDEIRRLGYSRFPDEAAEHFHETSSRIRKELHARLQAGVS